MRATTVSSRRDLAAAPIALLNPQAAEVARRTRRRLPPPDAVAAARGDLVPAATRRPGA